MSQPKIVYLCLQATREGQASHAHVHEIIHGLQRRGISAQLIEPRYAGWHFLPGAVGRLWEFLRMQAAVWFKTGRHRDAFYVRSHFALFPTALLAKMFGVPVIQEINGPYEDLFIAWPGTRRFRSFFTWLARTQFRWADALITVTPGLKEWVRQEAGHDRVWVVPNGANTDLFRPDARSSYRLPEFYAVIFGALTKWQGIDLLLEAVEHPDWPTDLHLVLAGEGAEQPQVEAAAKRNPHLLYLGRVPYKEMPGIVAGSLMLVWPGRDEAGRAQTGILGLKMFETLACGVPVLLSDFPAQADFIRQYDCGVVVPPESVDAVVQAVVLLWEHPEERAAMGRRGRLAVEQGHSWDKRAADTAVVLQHVLQARGNGET